MRTTKRMLGVRLEYLNRLLNCEDYSLTYSSLHRCWDLTTADGNTIIQSGFTAKEMMVYLDGLITGIWMKMGAYQ